MSRYEVKLVRWGSLTRLEQKEYYCDGNYDSTVYLKVIKDGVTTEIHSDRMEPEDARFTRDLSWVKRALENAYNTGFINGSTAGIESTEPTGDNYIRQHHPITFAPAMEAVRAAPADYGIVGTNVTGEQ